MQLMASAVVAKLLSMLGNTEMAWHFALFIAPLLTRDDLAK